jgi:dTDP-3-amino-3,4,6-trideoxy-alpha-D-glucose transaminase
LIRLQIIAAPEGALGVAETSKQIGFPARRMFFLTDVPEGVRRGGHAHRTLHQCLVGLRGGVTVDTERRGQRQTFRLDDYGTALVLPPGTWLDLREFTHDALLAVLASDEYDEGDYIRDREEFHAWEAGSQPVPYLDLNRYATAMSVEFDEALSGVVRSGWYIGGGAVERFEQEFAAYCSVAHAVGSGNGLGALALALRTWGIGRGDEVILPANTAIATALAVTETGATPVLVDVEEDSGLMNAHHVEQALTPRTRAVIPVHLYGHPVDMDPLLDLADGRGIQVLEDACQAHGASYKGRMCGSLGDAAAFSFYPTKNLGALGDGGAIVTSNAAVADCVRKLSNYGSAERYRHDLLGTNSRLDPMQAALLSAKLPHLDEWNRRRRAHASHYLERLADIDGLEPPVVRPWSSPNWHIFPVRVRNNRRADLIKTLTEAGIGTNIHYPIPVHLQPCYASMNWKQGQFPVSEQRATEQLSLPLDAMHSDEEIERVAEAVRAFFDPNESRCADAAGSVRRND